MASGLWQQSQEHGPNKVQVTILASEWGSSKGGLSTINRELAIQLAKFPEVKITYFLPKCSEEDKKVALSHGIKILEATPRPGFEEMDWLSFPPTHLEIDVIVGHGVKLGRQAQVIRDHHKCVWFQVVHTDPEELGMFKCYENPISRGEEKHNVEVELCKMANFVIGVGPKLAEAFRKYLRCCKKDQDVFEFTPGIFDEFVTVQHVPEERKQLGVLVFGRGDAEEFELKGFDIAATSVAALPDTHLVFVGAADGKHEEIANRLLKCGIPKNRLRVRSYMKSRESLKEFFCEVDLVLMPSRTEGFGLAGLEALSAGLPVIVSKNSGFGEALGNVPFGSSFVIDSEDPNAWTAAIKDIWNKNRRRRLGEAKVLRDSYGMIYSWSERCKDLKKMINSLNGAVKQKIERLENSKQSTEVKVNLLQACPEKLVELIKRDYKGGVLCPFPWCEDELQLELSNVFTRLQIISKKKERARLTDNIVNMKDVFSPHEECDRPRVVLIEGQPGMGKTTYCQKLAYDWSMAGIPPEASFPIVEILLLLKCRDMKTAVIEEDINDQLLPLDAEKKEKENFFEFIRRNQSKILLVLDGLDELRHDLLQGFLPLIKGKVFSNVYLMLTARHEAGTEVRRYCDTLLEIVGFTNEDAQSYIKKYFTNHENPSLAKKMIKKLKRSSQLWELTANPLNTALLCLVFEDSEGKFPSNRTKLYDELVSCALRRYCAKKEVSLCNNDYIEAFAEQLSLLGKMAFEALLNNQAYFTGDELKCQSTEFLEFGFLSREASVSKIRPNPSYSFTHKTFQEYFAAFHLAHQLLKEDVEKVTLLAQLSPVDKYWQVWGFLITLVASKGDDVADLLVSCLCNSFFRDTQINMLPELSWADEEESEEEEEDGSNSSDDFFSYDMRYDEYNEDFDDNEDGVVADINEDSGGGNDSFEVAVCEDDSFSWSLPLERSALADIRVENFLTETCNLIADCEGGRNELKDYQKKMIHTLARCFPLSTVCVPSYGVHNILVLREYLKENSALTELLWYASLDELALGTIKHILQTSQRLVGLHLRTDLNSTSLTPALQSNSTLTRLNLRYARIRISGAKALGKVLQSNRTLTHLNLHANMVSHIGAQAIAKGLQSNNVLKHLDLSNNTIGDQGAVALAHVLKSNHTLTYLDVGYSVEFMEGKPDFYRPSSDFDDVRSEFIGESGALAIAHALQSNCSLTYLDLHGNNVNDSAAAALGQALQSNCTLTHFYLMGILGIFRPTKIHFGNSGAVAFAKALQSSGTQLTRLDLHNTSINSSVAMALAEGLQSNRSLERLDLGGNEIECSGAKSLAKALKSNRALTHLGLRSNHIGDSGATEFAKTLRYYNDTLTFLDLRENPIGKLGKQNLQQINARTSCTLKFHEQRWAT